MGGSVGVGTTGGTTTGCSVVMYSVRQNRRGRTRRRRVGGITVEAGSTRPVSQRLSRRDVDGLATRRGPSRSGRKPR